MLLVYVLKCFISKVLIKTDNEWTYFCGNIGPVGLPPSYCMHARIVCKSVFLLKNWPKIPFSQIIKKHLHVFLFNLSVVLLFTKRNMILLDTHLISPKAYIFCQLITNISHFYSLIQSYKKQIYVLWHN